MNYNILGSSSKGNSIIVEDILMLDCGVSYAKIKKYLNKVKLIFISHVHQDHLNSTSIKQIAYNYPNIKFVCGSEYVVMKLTKCGISYSNIYVLKANKWFDLGIIKLKLEQLTHDTPNYLLKWEYKSKRGVYIVDTSNVDNVKAKSYNLYLIESNYNEEILKKHIENCEDENKLFYLNRVSNTHLSFEQANSFLIENMGENSEFDYIHKSNYNFREEE